MLERFLRYVRIDTQAQEGSSTYPSTAKQLDLSRLLADELREIGLEDVELSAHGYVFATLPGTPGAPVIGLIAHVDTTPESPGTGVSPIVHQDYAGGPIVLPGDLSQVVDPEELTELAQRIGHDIVTSDGTTLLGADDKAGVAEIMAAVAYLQGATHPSRVRPFASASPSTRRLVTGRTTSTSRRSVPRRPTRSTAPASGSWRSRRSRRVS